MPSFKGWRYFADKEGDQLPAVAEGTEIPSDAIEIPEVPTTGLDKADLEKKVWIPYDPPYFEKRRAAYIEELGDIGNQFDAIFKALTLLVPILQKTGQMTPEELEALTPNKEANKDTPAGWAGRVQEIKERFPKD